MRIVRSLVRGAALAIGVTLLLGAALALGIFGALVLAAWFA